MFVEVTPVPCMKRQMEAIPVSNGFPLLKNLYPGAEGKEEERNEALDGLFVSSADDSFVMVKSFSSKRQEFGEFNQACEYFFCESNMARKF